MIPLVIIGAGGHARVVIELVRAAGRFNIVGLLDPAPPSDRILGVKVLGDDGALADLRANGISHAFVALGANAVRQRVANRLAEMDFTRPCLAHPSAEISPSAERRAGSLVMARAVLGTEALLDEDAILNTGAVADHDVRLGACCHVAPGCALAGGVVVGARSFLGVGTSVRPEIRIGSDVVVGAGAAVVSDLSDGIRAIGVPAKPMKGV
ncbi:hexapeptide transferase [Fulvimarina endophytica]|uniref:Hexapeptide transferase n=1 Tax=Fulvimarina endophytica TaxID=2293836 RepID=A0A371X343_9HYPH|nr:NeuD/PglB/VioB family sugar acetyltransferase [Fulvimarina endophytica]RFC63651.1 hexapeptide transferase [Fulvimarina endophytica]